jgi:hypothetical protein
MGEVILPGDAVQMIRELQRKVGELERRTQSLTTFPNYTAANRPAAADVKPGTAIFNIDTAEGQMSDGSTWVVLG